MEEYEKKNDSYIRPNVVWKRTLIMRNLRRLLTIKMITTRGIMVTFLQDDDEEKDDYYIDDDAYTSTIQMDYLLKYFEPLILDEI